jgi:hypothetical protein
MEFELDMSNLMFNSAITKTVTVIIVVCCILVAIIAGVVYSDVLFSTQNPSPTTSQSPLLTSTPTPSVSVTTPSVRVMPTINLTSNTTNTKAISTIKLTAAFSQPINGQAKLQWAIGGSDFIFSINQNVTDGVSTHNFFGFDTLATYQFRVVWDGDDTYNNATSNIVSVAVIG